MNYKTRKLLAKTRTFIRNHETGVVRFMTTVMILLVLDVALLVTGCIMESCKDSKEVDVTYIDHNTIMPHDTHTFKTAQEEYDFLIEANRFKRECLELAMEGHDIIESIMYDGLDSEIKYSPKELDEALETNGYYDIINKLDSLLDTQM